MTYTKPPDARRHSLSQPHYIASMGNGAGYKSHSSSGHVAFSSTKLVHAVDGHLPGGPQSQSKRQDPDHPIVPPPEHWDNLSKLCYVKGGKEHSTFPEVTRTTQRPLLNPAELERNLLKKACQFASEFLRNCNAKRLTELKRFACRT